MLTLISISYSSAVLTRPSGFKLDLNLNSYLFCNLDWDVSPYQNQLLRLVAVNVTNIKYIFFRIVSHCNITSYFLKASFIINEIKF